MEFSTRDGVVIHGESSGQGLPTVFVHGWATTGRIWRGTVDRLELPGHLVRIDLRGTGFSDKPLQSKAYTLRYFAEDVVDVIAALGGRCRLVGHSMGGQIAQYVASHHPDQVERLVLVSPVPASGVPLDDATVAAFKGMAGRREGMEQILGSMMGTPPDEAVFRALVDDAASVLPVQYRAALDAWRSADFADMLAQIRCPTRVLCGSLEAPLTPELVQLTVVDRIAGARLHVLDGVGHYPHFECPDRFARALRTALTD